MSEAGPSPGLCAVCERLGNQWLHLLSNSHPPIPHATLSGFFGALAVVLATIGLYGVIAYLVVRRTNEIGIRMALGATPARILAMVVREAALLLLFGIVAGALLTLAAGRQASALFYDLKPWDPAVLTAAALGLAAVAITASFLPARRAARLEPTVALREE